MPVASQIRPSRHNHKQSSTMTLKLLKKRLSNRISSSNDVKQLTPQTSDDDDTSVTYCDSRRSSLTTASILSPASSSTDELKALAAKKKFDKVVKMISESEMKDWLPGHSLEDSASWPLNTSTPLHWVLQYQKVPLSAVERIIEILQTKFNICIPEEFSDHMGRTPLHVAVASACCSEEVMERLLQGETLVMPAITRDIWQRTPLHWACQPVLEKGRKLEMAKFYQKQAACKLLDEYAEAVFIRDIEGKTPLDYARENKSTSLLYLERRFKQFEKTDEKEYQAPSFQHVPGEPHPNDDVSTIRELEY